MRLRFFLSSALGLAACFHDDTAVDASTIVTGAPHATGESTTGESTTGEPTTATSVVSSPSATSSATGDSDAGSGSTGEPPPEAIRLVVDASGAPGTFPTLAAAYAAIGAEDDYDIVVRDGIYVDESIDWASDRLWVDHRVRVVADAGHVPVFEGMGDGTFMRVAIQEGRATRLELEGLTVRNYFQIMSLDGGSPPNDAGTWNGGIVVRRCVFSEIGDRNDDGVGQAWGAFVFEYSYDNLFEDNVFHNVYSGPNDAPGQIHAFYFSHGSSRNVVRGNYIVGGSHDPFRVRNGADDNRIEANYVDRAGVWAHATRYRNLAVGEGTIAGNALADNLLLHGWGDAMLGTPTACFDNPNGNGSHQVPCGADEFVAEAGNLFVDARPNGVAPDAAALGDFDGDGVADPAVALQEPGAAWVVRSLVRPSHLGRVLWKQGAGSVAALAAGDPDGGGRDRLAGVGVSGGVTRLVLGTGDGGAGLTDVAELWAGGDGSERITALAAGDADGDGRAELYVATSVAGGTRVYASDWATPGLGALQQSPQAETITAMAVGDLDGDGADDLVLGLRDGGGGRVWVGAPDGGVGEQVYAEAGTSVLALTAVEYDGDPGDGLELLTSVDTVDGGRVWRGHGVGADGVTNLGISYAHDSFRVRALASDASGHVLVAFATPGGVVVQVWLTDDADAEPGGAKLWEWPKIW